MHVIYKNNVRLCHELVQDIFTFAPKLKNHVENYQL